MLAQYTSRTLMTMVSYFPSLYNLTLVFECIKVTEYIFVQQIETSTVMVVVEKSRGINYRSIIITFALYLSLVHCRLILGIPVSLSHTVGGKKIPSLGCHND